MSSKKLRGDPKSKTSRRVLPMPAALAAALQMHLQQDERRLQLLGLDTCEYVFTSVEKGGPLDPSRLYDAVKAIIADTDLPQDITPHSLRHSCASFLIAQNVHPKTIQSILGHSSIRISLDLYGHLFPGQLDDAADKVEALLGTSPSEDRVLEIPPKKVESE